jgi:parallel beta-helix repeat protein
MKFLNAFKIGPLEIWLFALVFFLAATTGHAQASSLELYGTFHAMGVIVELETSDDPDQDAVALLQYKTGGGNYQTGFPLSRVTGTRMVGSLFWLEPGTVYDVQIVFSDPDGLLDGVILESSASTREEISIPVPNNSFYVSPDGGGTACTLGDPCSLAQGLNSAQPGDEVMLLGGVYYEGGMAIPRSGIQGAPIVIRSFPGEQAIIDGADPADFTWEKQEGGEWKTRVNEESPHLVLSRGNRLYPYQNLTDLQSLSWGIAGFFADGTDLYVHLAQDADPNHENMLVSRYNQAFLVEHNYIYFLDITFRHYGRGSYAKAIYFNNAGNNLVQGCTFAVNDLGIGIKRASGNNVIQNCNFYDTTFSWPWDAVKDGSQLETGGIRFYDPVDGRGNIIRRNIFHDYFDGFGVCPSSSSSVTNETDVYENTVFRISDDGMETDGQASNVRIWKNTFHDVLMGTSLAPVYTGPVYAIRNLIYRTGVSNSDYTGSPFKFNSGYAKSGPMYLFHNTCDAALPGNNGLYIKAPGDWEMIYSRNNIWSGTDYALNNYNENQPIDFDHDVLYTTNLDEFVYWGDGANRHMYDLLTFQTETGQEMNGINVAPGFTDPQNGNYTLPPGNDLIDEGIFIPGINDGYSGGSPDMGAFEFEGCESDFNLDGDVDGKDLAQFAAAFSENCLEVFAAGFGQ